MEGRTWPERTAGLSDLIPVHEASPANKRPGCRQKFLFSAGGVSWILFVPSKSQQSGLRFDLIGENTRFAKILCQIGLATAEISLPHVSASKSRDVDVRDSRSSSVIHPRKQL